jgi:hypothetical protein
MLNCADEATTCTWLMVKQGLSEEARGERDADGEARLFPRGDDIDTLVNAITCHKKAPFVDG